MTNFEKVKESFYNQLSSMLRAVPKTNKPIVMGDFNGTVGIDWDKWSEILGKHGVGTCNSNKELLLTLCTKFDLTITNTLIKQKIERKTPWMHPRSKYWHTVDYIS